MVVGKLGSDVGRTHAQEIGTPRTGAVEQQQPGGLEILEMRDAVEKMLMLLVRLLELVLNESGRADGGSKDSHALGCSW